MQRDGVVPAPMMYRKVADAPVRLPSDGNHHLVLAGRNIRRRQTADRVIRGNTDTSDDGSHGGIPISRQELIAQRITGWDRWCTPSATAAGCAWQSCPTAVFARICGPRWARSPGLELPAMTCRPVRTSAVLVPLHSGFDRLDGGLPPTIACPPGWGSTQEQFGFWTGRRVRAARRRAARRADRRARSWRGCGSRFDPTRSSATASGHPGSGRLLVRSGRRFRAQAGYPGASIGLPIPDAASQEFPDIKMQSVR